MCAGIPDRPSPTVSEVFGPEDLGTAVAGADHVVAALPGGAATRGLISREVISAMKPGAYFCNVGRGASVDEAALIERLQDGSLAGAGLDVFATEPLPDDSPLWSMENVIVTPHMAGYTWDCADELCEVFSANLARYGADEPLRNVDNGCLQVVLRSHSSTFQHDVDATRTSFHQAVPTDAIDPADVRAFELEPGEFVLFSENALHGSGPNRTADQRIALTPRVTVPFVRVTGNPLYAGRDRARHAPDERREVAILRGHDYTGRHHVVPLPCPGG